MSATLREAFLAEARRVLRPGGVLAIADAIAGAAPVELIQGALVSGLMRYWNIPRVNYYGLEAGRIGRGWSNMRSWLRASSTVNIPEP